MEPDPNNSGRSASNRGQGNSHPVGDQVAAAIFRLAEAYLGNAYSGKCGSSSMRFAWRFLNALFGVLSFYASVVVFGGEGPDTQLSRFLVVVGSSVEGQVMSVVLAIGISALLSIVISTSIKNGGPLRLFVAGVIVSSLPFAISGRLP